MLLLRVGAKRRGNVREAVSRLMAEVVGSSSVVCLAGDAYLGELRHRDNDSVDGRHAYLGELRRRKH
jgi:hypothetical protein